jgi:hypothetical protein
MAHQIIYIEWDGPYFFEECHELNDESCDYGLYQVYGVHPLYGSEVLLYIGKTDDRIFALHLADEQEYWESEVDFHPLTIYVGRLAGAATPDGEQWGREMDQAARLLIYSHVPVFNGRELGASPDEDLKDIHVINWGSQMDLAPEVSGARWLYKFSQLPSYNVYGSHGERGD